MATPTVMWTAEPAPVPGTHEITGRLARVPQSRSPLAADIARSVAFRWYQRPDAEAARAAAAADPQKKAELAGELAEVRAAARAGQIDTWMRRQARYSGPLAHTA